MHRLPNVVTALSASLLLVACGPDKVDFNALEEQRQIAKDNSLINAEKYRKANPRFGGQFKALPQGDSSQTETCPQGDGWATVDLVSTNDAAPETHTIKCSTVSGALACYSEADFMKKPFAKQDGKCDESLPKKLTPIPR